MSLTLEEASRRRVRDALSALDVTFGAVPTVDAEWHVDQSAYERTRERHEAGTVGAAQTWTTRDDGAVLLVRDDADDQWRKPSGRHERGESLVETAVRETKAETGVHVTIHDVAVAKHVHVTTAATESPPPIHRLVPVFEATPAADPDPLSTGVDGADAVRWFHEAPTDFRDGDHLEHLSFPAID